jgi:type IV secretory pathway TrbD component
LSENGIPRRYRNLRTANWTAGLFVFTLGVVGNAPLSWMAFVVGLGLLFYSTELTEMGYRLDPQRHVVQDYLQFVGQVTSLGLGFAGLIGVFRDHQLGWIAGLAFAALYAAADWYIGHYGTPLPLLRLVKRLTARNIASKI